MYFSFINQGPDKLSGLFFAGEEEKVGDKKDDLGTDHLKIGDEHLNDLSLTGRSDVSNPLRTR